MNEVDLRRHAEGYVALKITLGMPMRAERRLLDDYIRFVAACHGTEPLRAQLAVDWACQRVNGRGEAGQAQRLSVARGFLSYLKAIVPGTEIPPHGILRAYRRRKPYLFSRAEVGRIMDAVARFEPKDSLRPHVYRTLVGLLASTGIRVGEAVRLTVADVGFDAELPTLRIVNTKFQKSRLVPLHPTTASALREYARERERLKYGGMTDAFLVSETGTSLKSSTAWRTFHRLLDRLGIRARKGGRQPTLHSLRHTFAVERLTTWCRDGADVRSMVPSLSVYMGHVCPQDTYWYLTATPELLQAASDTFVEFAESGGVT